MAKTVASLTMLLLAKLHPSWSQPGQCQNYSIGSEKKREIREQYHINKFNTFYEGLNRQHEARRGGHYRPHPYPLSRTPPLLSTKCG